MLSFGCAGFGKKLSPQQYDKFCERVGKPTLYMDMLGLDDSVLPWNMRHHNGNHSTALLNLLKMEDGGVVRYAFERMARYVADQGPDLAIIPFCRRGKHRSVAQCCLNGHVLTRAGYEVRFHHRSRNNTGKKQVAMRIF